MGEKQSQFFGLNIPTALRTLVKEKVRNGPYLNESEFVRTAIREKIERENDK